MRAARVAGKVRLGARGRQKGLLCGIETSGDLGGPFIQTASTCTAAPGSWNSSLVGWEALTGKPRRRVRFPCMGSSLAPKQGLQRKKLAIREECWNIRPGFARPSPPLTPVPNRWLRQDTCKAARSRRLRAALRTRATVSDHIRSPTIPVPDRSVPRPKNLFLDTFGPLGPTELRIPVSRRQPLPSPGLSSGLPSRKPPPALHTSSPGLGA